MACIATPMNNNTTTKSATEIEEIGNYLEQIFSRAPKKNHETIEQIGKPFVQWLKKHME
jgi:hypothetical protein